MFKLAVVPEAALPHERRQVQLVSCNRLALPLGHEGWPYGQCDASHWLSALKSGLHPPSMNPQRTHVPHPFLST